MLKNSVAAFGIAALAGAGTLNALPQAQANPVAQYGGVQYAACNPCNPCAAKAANPCAAANPCGASNPCAAKKPVPASANPCAAKNPCKPGSPKK